MKRSSRSRSRTVAARSALRAGEIAWLAPWVIAMRTFSMWSPTPTAAQRRDVVTMFSEKPAAAIESATAAWMALAKVQQQAWLNAWDAALVPVGRRVRSNARRLSRRTR